MKWINWGGTVTGQFQNGAVYLGGKDCKSLLTGGKLRTDTKNMASGKKGLSDWGGKLIRYQHQ